MRPAGEIRQALLGAASKLCRHEDAQWRGATLAELAESACVGREAARQCVSNMKRAGALAIVHERAVDYRNRPVAEYAPAELLQEQSSGMGAGFADLSQCMADWVR